MNEHTTGSTEHKDEQATNAPQPESTPTSEQPSEPTPATTPPADNAPAPEADAPARPPAPAEQDVSAELEAEIADADLNAMMEASITAEDSKPAAEPEAVHHEIRRGRIAAVRGEDVFVELTGEMGKMQGIVPLTQFDRAPRIGAIMDFVVDRIDENEGLIYLSREGAISRATWDQLNPGSAVEARVTSTNKGGLELELVGGIRAFMPASQVDIHHVDDLEALVGEKLEAIVQEIDRRSKKVLISRRQYLQQKREAARQKVLAELEVDQIREGTISSITDYGAFVDLGGLDGLLHVSDMTYGRVEKPSEVVKVGDNVKVKVLKIQQGEKGPRISLGLKQIEPDPWENVAETFNVGDEVTGRVTRTANFGAFVEVADGVEGLLPLSEMSWKRVNNADDVVRVGDTIKLSVISLEPQRKRMSLSLKAAGGDPWDGASLKYPQNAVVEGKVLGTTDFGAFIELEEGVEGLVHISELADRRVNQVEDVLNVGESKKFRVLEISDADRKIKLSLKQVDKPIEKTVEQLQPRNLGKAKRQAPRNLQSGLGKSDAMGMGLGDLKLDDLK
ncbi:S1 RNA-binding domain-containing protein [Mucisphaera calidilacus]|uniref:30S ribosomal protein S1 n=1 Tax=Mucisphaera calidilacus TaxID=2527982 RepID=A0A518BYP2_9BACT|nr:S1 RNA-binding domain-containing protein [Mucisphaera calidilacus]QDU72095.1 30S ribosomal protein S1 [Mucisphaera calidilacus]